MSVGSFNPEKEVKKLQDLVKKLEQQNEILRTQQFDEKVENPPPTPPPPPPPREETPPPPPPPPVNQPSSDSADEIMDCDPELIEEESWLLRPVKKPSAQELSQTAVEWMREYFDDPSHGLGSSKKLLLNKLEEFRLIGNSRVNDKSAKDVSPIDSPDRDQRQFPYMKQPAIMDLSSRIDSGTFARTRKNERYSKSASPFSPRIEEPSVKQRMQQLVDREEPLNDMTDVRVMARLQEESLKQQVHNLTHRSRTGSQASVNSSNGSLDEIPIDNSMSLRHDDKYKTFTRRKPSGMKPPSPTSSLSQSGRNHSQLPSMSSQPNHEEMHLSKNYDGGSPLRQSGLKPPSRSGLRPPSSGLPRPSMLPRPGRFK